MLKKLALSTAAVLLTVGSFVGDACRRRRRRA